MLVPQVRNVYVIYGIDEAPASFPAAFQAAAPFGVDIGGVNPAFFAVNQEAEYDSWLSPGSDAGLTTELSTIGIDFETWSDADGLSFDNGAVFWMDPNAAPATTTCVVAQLTVLTGENKRHTSTTAATT